MLLSSPVDLDLDLELLESHPSISFVLRYISCIMYRSRSLDLPSILPLGIGPTVGTLDTALAGRTDATGPVSFQHGRLGNQLVDLVLRSVLLADLGAHVDVAAGAGIVHPQPRRTALGGIGRGSPGGRLGKIGLGGGVSAPVVQIILMDGRGTRIIAEGIELPSPKGPFQFLSRLLSRLLRAHGRFLVVLLLLLCMLIILILILLLLLLWRNICRTRPNRWCGR